MSSMAKDIRTYVIAVLLLLVSSIHIDNTVKMCKSSSSSLYHAYPVTGTPCGSSLDHITTRISDIRHSLATLASKIMHARKSNCA